MIDWRAIDTVLLDMDGTLLDLHFDNYFWLTHLPARYAQHHGLCPDEASQKLHQLFHETRGTLNWYCLDFWTRNLEVNIRQLKEEVQHLIAERPHVMQFLRALQAADKQRILITNAHRESLDLKLAVTGIERELDKIISSHDYGYPKEDQQFWHTLAEHVQFNPSTTLFIDDSLAVLGAAERYGIKHLCAIRQPDSKKGAIDTLHFPAINHFDDLLPVIPSAPSTRHG